MRKFTFFLALMVAMVTTAFAQTPVLELSQEEIGSYPYALSDDDAAKVFALSDLTVAVRINTAGVSGRRGLFVTSSPSAAKNTSGKGTNSPYIALGLNADNISYLASWTSGDRFSGAAKMTANTNDIICVYVLNPSKGKFELYYNGSPDRNWSGTNPNAFMSGYEIATPKMVKEDYSDAKIYIGGGMSSAGAGEVFDGTITGVKVYDGALTASQIAAISFEDPALLAAAQAEFNTAYAAAQAILDEAELVVNSTDLPLQVTNANAAYYLWCNNPEATEGPIANLIDGSTDSNSFFHTNWHGGGETPHYIEVDLGTGNELSEFSFAYTTRNFTGADDYPNIIEIKGSNDKQNYSDICTITGLPSRSNTYWSSDNIVATTAYRYIRFAVTKTEMSNRTYWHMGEFDIYTNSITVADKYNAVANEVASLKNLCDSHANNASYNTATLTAAAAAINALVETVNAGVVVAEPVTFEVYALDDYMNPSPLQGEVSKLGFVVFAASDNNAVLAAAAADAPKVAIFDTDKDSYVAEASEIKFGDLLDKGMQLVALQFDGFNTPGNYKVHAPAGAFTVNGQPSEDVISADFTIPAPVVPETKVFEVEGVTPANGAEVDAINEIKIKFTENITLQQNPATWSFYPVNLVDENNNVIELTTSDDANIWSLAVFTPAEPITAAGTYTLDLSQIMLDGGVCEGSYSWTVVEPVKPLEVVSYTPTEAVEKLETITITFSDEIEGQFDATDLMKPQIYLGSKSNGCSYEVNGNVLTITPFYAITTAKEYALQIPAGVGITRKATGEAVTMSGEIVFKVVEPAKFEVVSYTPTEDVESLSTITVTFSEEIAGKFDIMAMDQIYLKSASNGCSYEVNGNVLTITPFNAITTPGEYPLNIPSGLITRKSNGEAVTMNGEIVFKVVEPASAETPALEATGYDRNPLETSYDFNTGLLGKYLLTGVKINFGEVVKRYTTDLSGDYGQILDAEGNVVATLNKCMGGNGTNNTFATPYSATAIETPGTYKVVVKSGVILSADGTKEYKGGEFTFTVEKAAVEITPSAEDGFCYNATFSSVEEFNEWTITVKNAENDVVINNEVKATLKCGETVYEAAVTVEKDGNIQNITLAFDGEFAEGRYTIDVPAGLFTVDGTANEAYAQSTFTYKKPSLEITKDWTSWAELFTEKYMMPREVTITINNATEVTVTEGLAATLTVGETTYNSTVNFTNDGNNYWISFKFAEIETIYYSEEDFIQGKYTLTIPADLYTVNGEANVEETTTFTYGKAVVEEFSVASISPAAGNVSELSRIEIAFSNNTKPELLIVTNGANKRFFFMPKDGAFVAVDPLKNYAEAPITEPGTYTLDLSELEGLTGDKVFTWTIEEAVVAPTLNETAVFDFTYNAWGIQEGLDPVSFAGTKTAGDYTDGINTIHIDPTAKKGQFYYENGYLRIQKPGSKIVLPAFDFAVEKIEVVGHSAGSSSPNVDMNVYVDGTAVSTACIGTTATYTYAIAADKQAAGNAYELVIGSNGGDYNSIMYITYIKVYPAENKLEAPVINLASGVYVGEQTVNAHSATTDIEGVTDVTYYYTTDGNEPTTEDEESVDGNITITESCTLKVVVEFTLGDKTYVSASTSAEYIITEAATYHKAVAVENGNYFLVADGKVAAPIEGTTLPAVEVTVEGNDATAPVYFAITLEETAAGYYIKDVNGKYIYNTQMTPHKLASSTSAPMDAWTIEIADDENSTATIKCNGYVLALNKGVFCTVQLGGTDVPVMPTLYGTHATGINEAVVNGEAIESIYDITGRKIEKITKSGIYIVNGKKVLVK